MKENFRQAKKILGANTSQSNIVAINGCCYGRNTKPDKGEYLKYCGQIFWEFISGDKDLYLTIIEPFGHKAKEKNEAFLKAYTSITNKFTVEFTKDYCNDNFQIMWDKIVKINSGAESKSLRKK